MGGVMRRSPKQTPESRARNLRRRNLFVCGAVFGLAALFFVITIVKKGLAV